VVVILLSQVSAQNNLSTAEGRASFYSKAPVSDVDAQNDNVKMDLDPKSGDLSIDMNMRDFKFKSEKMGKDAEKKYLETEKFTKASFKGKIQGNIQYDKPGTYSAVAAGKLTLHGVTKDIKEKGTVTVVGKGKVKLHSQFMLALKDFSIDQPEILGKKMTAESMKVTIEGTLTSGVDSASKKKGSKN